MDLLHLSCDGTFSIPAWRLVLIRVRNILMLCVGFILMLPIVADSLMLTLMMGDCGLMSSCVDGMSLPRDALL